MRYLSSVLLVGFLAVSVPAGAADANTYTLTIKDHKFEPERLEVPANTKIKLLVKNENAGAAEFESHDLKREKIIKAGAQATVPVGPLAAGEYVFFDEFHEKTTRGTLVVK